jgi:hypothetical protein
VRTLRFLSPDESQRLMKQRKTRLLAASDMEQAAAAAEALAAEHKNVALVRALKTAIAVCYARRRSPARPSRRSRARRARS